MRIALILVALLAAWPIYGQMKALVENDGQWSGDFDFRYQRGAHQIYLNPHQLTFKLYEAGSQAIEAGHYHAPPFAEARRGHVYRMELLGADSTVKPQAENPESGRLNFLLGQDRQYWRKGLRQYRSVTYPDVYPHIDLRYQLSKNGTFKYEFIIHPGGDPEAIRLRYRGADTLGLAGDQLVVQTSVENVVENAPYAYSTSGDAKREIACHFALKDSTLTFTLSERPRDATVVIDPELIFSTYTGSSSDNWGFTATPASDDGVYTAGIAFGGAGSSGYPTSTGAFQDSLSGGQCDVVVSKFNEDGTKLEYSTYLGGGRNELPFSTLEGPEGSLIIMGITASANFPVTSLAYQGSFVGGAAERMDQLGFFPAPDNFNLFISILDSSGGGLNASTYLGDSLSIGKNSAIHFNFGDELRGDLALDSNGSIYLTTSTHSSSLPTTTGSVQPLHGGGQDGYIAKLSSNLQNLIWASYLGGSGDDAAFSLALTANEQLYLTGASESQDLLPGMGGYQANNAGGVDGLIAELNPANGALKNFTYTGTADHDISYFIDTDEQGRVYCLGQTYGDFPILGPQVYADSGSAHFLQRFSTDLSASDRSTVFGDGQNDAINISPTGLMVDACGSMYVAGFMPRAGSRGSAVAPANNRLPLQNPVQSSTDGQDFYFLTLHASWQRLTFASYFGDANSYDHVDGGTSRFRKDGSVFHAVCAGCQGSSTFPTTDSAFSSSNGSSNCNMAVFRFDYASEGIDAQVALPPEQSDTLCLPDTIPFIDSSFNADLLLVQYPDGRIDTNRLDLLFLTDSGNTRVKFFALDTLCNRIDSTELQIIGVQEKPTADFSLEYDSCDLAAGVTFVNESSDSQNYTWLVDSTAIDANSNSPTLELDTGSYFVQLIAENTRCQRRDTLSRNVHIQERSQNHRLELDYDPCATDRQLELILTTENYALREIEIDGRMLSDTADTLHYSFPLPGQYPLRVRLYDSVCDRELVLEDELIFHESADSLLMPNVFTPNGDGENDSFGPLLSRDPDFFEEYHFEVYNRWGRRIFSTSQPGGRWDGRFENRMLSEDVYYYLVDYRDICGRLRKQKGFVHLMR